MAMLAAALPAIAGAAGTAAAAGSSFATLATIAQIGGTILSGIGALQSLSGGNQQAKGIQAAAVQAAGQERAKSQYAAQEQRRQAALVSSRARAVAGASGGGATDPTIVDITSELAGEGEYRALTAMYEGEDRARGIVSQGNADAYSAKASGHTGFMSGMSNVLSGATSLFSKYSAPSNSASYPTIQDPAAGKWKTYQTPFGNRNFFG